MKPLANTARFLNLAIIAWKTVKSVKPPEVLNFNFTYHYQVFTYFFRIKVVVPSSVASASSWKSKIPVKIFFFFILFSRKSLARAKHCLRCIFITNLLWQESMITQGAKNNAKVLLLPWKSSLLLIRNKCTTVYLRGKKMFLKLKLHYIDVSDEFQYLFLFGYACFMCSLYVLGLLSGWFISAILRQGLASLVNLITCRRLIMAVESPWVLILLLWWHTSSEDIEANRSLKPHAFMQVNFTALDSRVDGGASISWKLLNTFRLLILVCTTALVSGCLIGLPVKWYCIPNAIPECSAIRKCSTHTQTSIHWQQAHSGNCALAPKKCMHRTFTQKLLTPSEYRFTGRTD